MVIMTILLEAVEEEGDDTGGAGAALPVARADAVAAAVNGIKDS